MSKRKPLAIRKPCGRISTRGTVELLPPTQIRRMVDAAASGMRDALWASQLGRLHLAGKLNASQLAAGKRWTELVANYAEASQAPRPPRTKPLDNADGTSIDPDSIAGAKEARRHERATADYLDGRHALRLAGSAAERVVDSVCRASSS
jgi:hypothetical protein